MNIHISIPNGKTFHALRKFIEEKTRHHLKNILGKGGRVRIRVKSISKRTKRANECLIEISDGTGKPTIVRSQGERHHPIILDALRRSKRVYYNERTAQ